MLGTSGAFSVCAFSRVVSPFLPLFRYYSIVYSIYMRICTVATHLFASRAHRDKRKSYSFILPWSQKSTLTDSISTWGTGTFNKPKANVDMLVRGWSEMCGMLKIEEGGNFCFPNHIKAQFFIFIICSVSQWAPPPSGFDLDTWIPVFSTGLAVLPCKFKLPSKWDNGQVHLHLHHPPWCSVKWDFLH